MRISIAIEALTGSFDTDMQRTAKRAEQRSREIQRSFDRMGSRIRGVLGGLFAGFSAGALFAGVIRNTIEAEQEMRQLEARVKSTGGAAGFTAEELLEMAGSLQQVTAFGDEAIANMESILLTFTQVRGDNFVKATEAILNMSTALDTDLKSAALQIGKALNDPILGVTALQRSGIQLTQQQKDLVKQLVETGDVAGAQGVILEELETQFGGAARAARDTFGGALTGLKEAAGNLLEGSGGNLIDAKDAVEDLTDILQDPAVIQAFGNITSAIVKMTSAVVKAVSAFANLGTEIGEGFARLAGVGTPIDDAANRIKELQRQIEAFSVGGVIPGSSAEANINLMKAEQAELQKLVDLNEELKKGREAASSVPAVPAATTTVLPPADLDGLEFFNMNELETKGHQMTQFFAKRREEMEEAYSMDGLEFFDMNELETRGHQATLMFQERAEEMKERFSEVSEFAKQASRNTQDIIADTLVNGFDDGVKGILQSFSDMITQLVAQAIAADIAGKLFGTNGVGSGGGLIGGAFDFLGDLFGGGRATGGPVAAGMVYQINENEPEFFRPDSGGEVIPLSKMPASSGGMRFTQNFYSQGRIDNRTAQQMQIEAARRQRVSTARLG